MSSFSKKGERESYKKYRQKVAKNFERFNNALMNMNFVYTQLVDRKDITAENIEKEIKKITTYEFTEFELNLLKKDLC